MGFLIDKFKTADLKNMNRILKKVAKVNNKSISYVRFDFLKTTLRYNIGYIDYMKGDYLNLKKEEKKDFLTTRNYYKIINYLNDRNYQFICRDKILTNNIYKDFIGRDFIDLRKASFADFKSFLKDKDVVYAKLYNGFGGQGIDKVIVKDIRDLKKAYNNYKKNKQYLIEEEIKQHEYLNKINPFALNNVRVVSVIANNEVNIFEIVLRINDGRCDVISSYDLEAILNEDGTLGGRMVDDELNIYDVHPKTGFDFKSIKIPYMKEVIELVKKAALVVPDIRLIGWDIAITPKGPVVIEANEYPCYTNYQYYLMHDRSVGYLKKLKELLGEEFEKIVL